MEPKLTQAQIGDALGLSQGQVSRVLKDAGISGARGAYSLADLVAVTEYRTLANVGMVGGVAYNYEAERARLTHEQADKTALENAELRGDLVRSSLVGPHWTEMVASMRARLVSVPPRIAGLIADIAVRAKVQAQSEALVYEALAEIEKDGLPVAARERIARAARNACASAGPPAAETDDEPVGERASDALGRGRVGAG